MSPPVSKHLFFRSMALIASLALPALVPLSHAQSGSDPKPTAKSPAAPGHAAAATAANSATARFGFGRSATPAEIAAWDIDVRPDGKGLPTGSGDVATGRAIYAAKCIACHGTGHEPASVKLPALPVFNRKNPGPDFTKGRSIGNYWPYATTVFDYVRRAMPFATPGSLTNDEVYALTAYVLFENNVIESTAILDATTLPKIRMPAQSRYVPDDRKGGPEIK